jgi:flagellar biogenesis protein FliO
MTTVDYLSRLAVALPLVIAVMAALWYATKRGWIQPPGVVASAHLRPIATLGLGPGARLVIVEFDGRRLLLAASRSGVTLLDHAQ